MIPDDFDTEVAKIGYRKAVRFFAVRIACVFVELALIIWLLT